MTVHNLCKKILCNFFVRTLQKILAMTEPSKDLTKDTATESVKENFKFPSIDNYPVQAPHYAIGRKT